MENECWENKKKIKKIKSMLFEGLKETYETKTNRIAEKYMGYHTTTDTNIVILLASHKKTPILTDEELQFIKKVQNRGELSRNDIIKTILKGLRVYDKRGLRKLEKFSEHDFHFIENFNGSDYGDSLTENIALYKCSKCNKKILKYWYEFPQSIF